LVVSRPLHRNMEGSISGTVKKLPAASTSYVVYTQSHAALPYTYKQGGNSLKLSLPGALLASTNTRIESRSSYIVLVELRCLYSLLEWDYPGMLRGLSFVLTCLHSLQIGRTVGAWRAPYILGVWKVSHIFKLLLLEEIYLVCIVSCYFYKTNLYPPQLSFQCLNE
jgi:hypothetical protein